ncbi:MAG: DUF3617 family protein [Sphingomonas sp.]|nr:DUF3617 family protein [Sphingomonas sp.]
MTKILIIAASSLALAACGSGGEEAPVEESAAPADALTPGQYDITMEVTSIDTKDEADARTDLEVGSVTNASVCVGDDGALPADAFAEGDDQCGIESPYARRGTLRQALRCNRDGEAVMLNVDGDFTADSVTATVETETFFQYAGDYAMKRSMTATRTGECTAEGENSADG